MSALTLIVSRLLVLIFIDGYHGGPDDESDDDYDDEDDDDGDVLLFSFLRPPLL